MEGLEAPGQCVQPLYHAAYASPIGARSDLLAAGTQVTQYLFDAFLVDDAHPFAGHAQGNEALFRFNPEPVLVQVGEEAPARAVLRVRYVVTGYRTLTGNLTDSGHDFLA